uniref:Uncharacterized protein n=1 Tax=Anguilla anguilla TaxID=7936 RepID=A0A0E9TQP4_ANGAN
MPRNSNLRPICEYSQHICEVLFNVSLNYIANRWKTGYPFSFCVPSILLKQR